MYTYPYRTRAIPIEQPFGTFYIAVLPSDFLRTVSFADQVRVAEVTSTGYRIAGTQRLQREERQKEIGKFINTVEAVFPTSVVLAANYKDDGDLELGEDRWRIEGGELVIPTDRKLVSVVDGQHRLWGFNYAVEERQKMPLVCSIFLDLPNPFQAYVFATVNFNQKKVDRSLAYELFGFDTEEERPDAWTPEKTAVFLTRKLNVEESSPLKGHIVVSPQDEDGMLAGDEWRVSTATIVDGLLRLFSKKPKADRTSMFAHPRSSRKRSDLADDGTPARELYRTTNDQAIYALASSFLKAANANLWTGAPPTSFIRRTVGLQALFDVLRILAAEAIGKKDLREEFFAEKIRPARGIDFSDNFFNPSGNGRSRIKHTLAVAMGLETLADVPPTDIADYERLTKAATGKAVEVAPARA